jgi:hypothetical protein
MAHLHQFDNLLRFVAIKIVTMTPFTNSMSIFDAHCQKLRFPKKSNASYSLYARRFSNHEQRSLEKFGTTHINPCISPNFLRITPYPY